MTESTLKAGVFGWPIEHSKSPRLHGHWLKRYGIEGTYAHLPSKPEDFAADVRRLVADGWRGANVTLPHKEAALALADIRTDRAMAIGAANTLVFGPDGVTADNTDGFGFIENLRSEPTWRPNRPAAVLGAGGAARAIVWSLIEAGAPEVRLMNRTRARAEALRVAFGARVRVCEWERRDAALADVGLIVNTTSLGMAGQPPLEIDLTKAADDATATDIVYTPLITPFLSQARERGLPIVDGLGMLLHQARPGFEAWFGVPPEVDETLRALMLAP